jgi:hypothetical protein
MHEHFTAGAINKNTSEYVFPSIATKENKYCCPHCQSDVVLRKGKVRVHHFAHKKETSQCSYYTKPTKKHLIMDAKLAMSTIYNNTDKRTIWLKNKCTRNCLTECMTVISMYNAAYPVLRYDKSSNYIVFQNTNLQSRESIIRDVEIIYENSVESLETKIIKKEIEELSSMPTRFSTISNPFEIRSIFEESRDETPNATVRRDLRIPDSDITELNNMLKASLSNWRVYISKTKACGTKYYYNSLTNTTTWFIPNDVIREEELLFTKININKIKSLEKELATVECAKQAKMEKEVETKIKEQDEKRVVLIELIHDDDDYSCSSSIDTIKIPNLLVENYHKHYKINVNNFLEQYKTFMEKDKANSDKKEDESPLATPSSKPYVLNCHLKETYVCSSCKNKDREMKQQEETIRKLFYEKYPMYNRNRPDISYRTSNSPPTVQAEEAKQRKKNLIRRLREQQDYTRFREQYLRNIKEK